MVHTALRRIIFWEYHRSTLYISHNITHRVVTCIISLVIDNDSLYKKFRRSITQRLINSHNFLSLTPPEVFFVTKRDQINQTTSCLNEPFWVGQLDFIFLSLLVGFENFWRFSIIWSTARMTFSKEDTS